MNEMTMTKNDNKDKTIQTISYDNDNTKIRQ